MQPAFFKKYSFNGTLNICSHRKSHFNKKKNETRVSKFCPELEHNLVPYSTGAVMDLVWQMYRLLVNLPNFSYCFSKFVLALFFSHVVEFLSQMKIPNLRDSLCQR